MNIEIKIEGYDQLVRQISAASKQIDFAASKALNATAREVRKAMPAGMRAALDRPTRFTASEGAMFIKPAKRQDLAAEVNFKDRQASYLRYQVLGGVRQPRSAGIKLPADVKLNAYGNIPKGLIGRLKTKAQAGTPSGRRRSSLRTSFFYGVPRGRGWEGAPRGLWRREPYRLVPVVMFEDTPARYRKRLNLRAIAEPVVGPAFQRAFSAALADALRTAR